MASATVPLKIVAKKLVAASQNSYQKRQLSAKVLLKPKYNKKVPNKYTMQCGCSEEIPTTYVPLSSWLHKNSPSKIAHRISEILFHQFSNIIIYIRDVAKILT